MMRETRVTLSELARVEPGTTWLSEQQTATLLGLEAAQLYRDHQDLVVGCRMIAGELMFDARDVVERVDRREAQPTSDADALLAELRAYGLAPAWLSDSKGDAA